jgi:hypothetical protein
MAKVLLVVAAVAAAAVAAPAFRAAPKDGMERRLIATADDQAAWMTEEEVFALIRANKNFIDVTDKKEGLLAPKRAGTLLPLFPPPHSPVRTLPRADLLSRSRSDPDQPVAPGRGQGPDCVRRH